MGKDLLKLFEKYKSIIKFIFIPLIVVSIIIFVNSINKSDVNNTSNNEKQNLLNQLTSSSSDSLTNSNNINNDNINSNDEEEKENIPKVNLKDLSKITIEEDNVADILTSYENDYYSIEVADITVYSNSIDVNVKYSLKDLENNDYIFISPKYTELRTNSGYLPLASFEGKGLIDVDMFWEDNLDSYIHHLIDKVNDSYADYRIPPGVEFEGTLRFNKPDDLNIVDNMKLFITSASYDYIIAISDIYKYGHNVSTIGNDIKSVKSNSQFRSKYIDVMNEYLDDIRIDCIIDNDNISNTMNSIDYLGNNKAFINDYHMLRITDLEIKDDSVNVNIKYSLKDLENNNYLFFSPNYTILIDDNEGFLRLKGFEGKGFVDLDKLFDENKDAYANSIFNIINDIPISNKIPPEVEFEGVLMFDLPADISVLDSMNLFITSTSYDYFHVVSDIGLSKLSQYYDGFSNIDDYFVNTLFGDKLVRNNEQFLYENYLELN